MFTEGMPHDWAKALDKRSRGLRQADTIDVVDARPPAYIALTSSRKESLQRCCRRPSLLVGVRFTSTSGLKRPSGTTLY